MDGLKGFPEAIKTVCSEVNIQSCILHQIRNSLRYISSKNTKPFMKDLKAVYQAPTEEAAVNALKALETPWGDKYPIVIQSWTNNWSD